MSRPGMARPPSSAGGMPGGMGGPRTMGPGGKKPAAKSKKKEEDVDRTTLPPGYQIPPEPTEEFTTTDECTDDPFDGLSKPDRAQKFAKYRDALVRGKFLNEKDEKKLIDEVVRSRLCEMTKKQARDDNRVAFWRLELTKELRATPAKGVQKEVRQYILQSIAKQAPMLFTYNILARINGAILLGELNESEEEGASVPAVPYIPAYEPLITLLNDEKQHGGVRALAVKGLVRIANDKDIKVDTRHQIVETLIARTNSSAGYAEWLQLRLVDSFAEIKILYSRDKKPYVAQALAQVLVDVNRPWSVRAQAAYAIGRLPYDRDVDLTLLAYEVVKLGRQMGDAYLKDPAPPHWKVYFMRVYLAFKPADDAEDRGKDGGLLKQVETKGAFASHKKSVQEAYQQLLPLVERALKGTAGVKEAVTKMDAWLVANPPQKRSIGQDQPELINNQLKPVLPDNTPRTANPPRTPSTAGG